MAAESVGAPVCPDHEVPAPQPGLDDLHPAEAAQSSASKILAMLEALAKIDSSTFGVTEVAAAIAVPKSTAHRLLKTLEEHEFVARAGSRYRMGARLVELGEAARLHRPDSARGVAGAGRPRLRREHGLLDSTDATTTSDPPDKRRRGNGTS